MPSGSRSRTFECDGTFIKRVVCRRICRQTHLWREPAQRRRKLFPAERRSQTNHHLFLQGWTAERRAVRRGYGKGCQTGKDRRLHPVTGRKENADTNGNETHLPPFLHRRVLFVRHRQPHPHPLVGQRPATVAQVLTGRQSCRFRPRQ